MKRVASLALLFLALALAAAPKAAVPFKGKTLDGATFDLSTLLGKKPIVLHFWASHCPPCLMEGPALEAIYERFQDRVAFVAVAVQDPPKMAAFRVREWGWRFPVVIDYYADVARAYGVPALPTSVFINRQGQIVERHLGMLVYPGHDALTPLLEALARSP